MNRAGDAPWAAEPASADIRGLDNVRLDLPLAGVGSRFLAVTLDQMVLAIVLLLFVIATVSVGTLLEGAGGWLLAIGAFGVFMIQVGYFSACEILMNGQTPGKVVLGLRTVSHLGGRPSTGAILIRNFLRSIDFLIGLPIMMLDSRWRRLGDLVASTLVVHDRQQPTLHLSRIPPFFGAREIAIAESLLHRADGMEADVALELCSRLIDFIRRRDPEWLAQALAGETEARDSLHLLRLVLRPELLEAGAASTPLAAGAGA